MASNISCFGCDYLKISSKYLLTFLLRMSGQTNLLISVENAAAPTETP